MATAEGSSWSFDLIALNPPETVLPNVKIWNVTNHHGLAYQILLSWPLHWTSPAEADEDALCMYVLDGNALGMTATEAWRRRVFIDRGHPNGIIVSIGYPITDSVYSPQRTVDFQPGPRHGADDLLHFIDATLRPFVHSQFPRVSFRRDALYGHSLGGLFVVYALLRRPGLFDTYLAASPGTAQWDSTLLSSWESEAEGSAAQTKTKPALRLAFGTLEARPVKRRVETEEAFQARRGFYASFEVGKSTQAIYERLRENPKLRHIEIKEYPWSDHATLGAVGLADGIEYFVDW